MVSPLMIYNIGLWSPATAVGLARDVGHPSFALVIQQGNKRKRKKDRQKKQKLYRSITVPGTTPVPFWAVPEVQDFG